MKLILLYPFLLILLQTKSCDRQDAGKLPVCIQTMITEYANRELQNPSGKFYEYDYRGKKVYLFVPPCCDQISKLYDSECNLLCSSGGITGRIDSLCQDFYLNRQNEKLIWEDLNQK